MVTLSNRKIKVIYNPVAKGGKSKKTLAKFEKFLIENNFDFVISETNAPLHAIELTKIAPEEGFNLVCALGGDGTAHEVANGAIEAGITFATIPAGSGNDFVGALGINGKWESGADVLLNGKTQKIPVVKSKDRYSINVLDVGFGGDVSKAANKHLKWISGSLKYSLITLALLTKHKPYPVSLTIDGETADWDLNLIAAGFGQTFGSGMNILPDARFNNKEMDVSIIHSTGKFKFLRIFPKVFSAGHVKYKDNVTMLKAKSIEIESKIDDKRILLGEAEGELFSEGSISFHVVPDALEVLIPKDWSLDNQSLKVK